MLVICRVPPVPLPTGPMAKPCIFSVPPVSATVVLEEPLPGLMSTMLFPILAVPPLTLNVPWAGPTELALLAIIKFVALSTPVALDPLPTLNVPTNARPLPIVPVVLLESAQAEAYPH